MTKEPNVKRAMEQLMDELQPQIANSPNDPRWKEFTDTLPGFEEFWNNWLQDMKDWADETLHPNSRRR
jgi:hypothetical protein